MLLTRAALAPALLLLVAAVAAQVRARWERGCTTARSALQDPSQHLAW